MFHDPDISNVLEYPLHFSLHAQNFIHRELHIHSRPCKIWVEAFLKLDSVEAISSRLFSSTNNLIGNWKLNIYINIKAKVIKEKIYKKQKYSEVKIVSVNRVSTRRTRGQSPKVNAWHLLYILLLSDTGIVMTTLYDWHFMPYWTPFMPCSNFLLDFPLEIHKSP